MAFDAARQLSLSFGEIDIAEIADEDARQGVQFVDVRQPHEWVGELGHIAGAKLVPLAQFLCGEGTEGLDPKRPVVLICRSGRRSVPATAYLTLLGFGQAYNLAGGMIAWNQAGLPITRKA